MKAKTIALIGNPNSGKTTLFNELTGTNQRIGNWPGVTVERVEGNVKSCTEKLQIIDLPGIYSLSSGAEDEAVARNFLLNDRPDLVVNVIDSANIERNLFLTTQLIEMRVPLLFVFTRKDIADKQGISIDMERLAKKLDSQVLFVSSLEKADMALLRDTLTDLVCGMRNTVPNITYPNEIESFLTKHDSAFASKSENAFERRWLLVSYAAGDGWAKKIAGEIGGFPAEAILHDIRRIEALHHDDMEVLIADARFAYIHGIIHDTVKYRLSRHDFTDTIDRLVLHSFFGLPFFVGVMYLMFSFAIGAGNLFIPFFDIMSGVLFVRLPGLLFSAIGAPALLETVIVHGIGAGLQTVATFIPVIFFMFFVLAVLEDSGYLARAAFVMDRFMRLIGLPGKSFVPMLVGFGCTVPAILGTRILETRRDRLFTMYMAPFMSCGAKLPVYMLFGVAFFPDNPGFVVFALYIAGIAGGVISGMLFRATIFKGDLSHFIMELPMYSLPRINHIMIHTWMRMKDFIVSAGLIIVIAVATLSVIRSIGIDGTFGNEDSEKSVLTVTAKAITPVLGPMGIERNHWQSVVALLTGVFSKESIVGTLSSLYSIESHEESELTIIQEGASAFTVLWHDFLAVFGIGEDDAQADDPAFFTHLRANFSGGAAQVFAYLLFILFYVPCVSATGTIAKEAGFMHAALLTVYSTVFAWVVAVLFYQFFAGCSFAAIGAAIGVSLFVSVALLIWGRLAPSKFN